MIGGGLALNDTGFILVQATCPTSSLSQSQVLEVYSGVTNKKEEDRGYKRSGRTLVRGAENDGSSAMLYVFEHVLVV